jgi:hypothetical protein
MKRSMRSSGTRAIWRARMLRTVLAQRTPEPKAHWAESLESR